MCIRDRRNISFWLLDAIKGSPIRNQLRDVQFCMEHPSSEKAKQIKKTYIKRLLNHTISTTNYYSSLNKKSELADFPIIRKTIIQENFEQFQSSIFKNKDNFKVSTSGSTGVPFFLFQNTEKRNRNYADNIYFFNKSNFNIGNLSLIHI